MNHDLLMKRCIDLGKKALGKTYPNPNVGALLFYDGKIISEGFTKEHGKNHAEIIKYKYQIFSKLNQKETYHFSHQGINIEQDQEIHTGAIEVAIDEGCLETYNGVVQSEELILLITDE